ncbi:hypothetical protein FJTKL_09588 [Diaporthe vaccinii]|uniref:Secreted protein n=1 Tax=Diaporthe vaccinii TaxID=105482 RepID=A0ABR4EMY4_9PEZI
MKLTLFSSLLAYAILATSPVAADFYIYRMWQIFYIDHYQTYSEEYGFFPGPPDCNDVNDRWHEQHANKDVSGSKHGGPQDSFDAEIIEFNNDIGHYSRLITRTHTDNYSRSHQFQAHSLRLTTTLTKATLHIKPITRTREAS